MKQNEIKKDSVVINYILQSFYRVLQIVLPLITTPYVSRTLTPDGVGEFNYVSSVSYFFVLFANLGISNHGNRTIAENSIDRDKLSSSFWNIFYCHFIVSLISVIFYIAFVFLFVKQFKIIFLCEVLTLLSAMFEITWFFTGLQQFRLTVARSTAARLFSVFLVFVLVKGRDDVWKYVAILSGGQFISQLLIWTQISKYIHYVKPDKSELIKNFKSMIVLFVPMLATSIYRNMDKILLTKICGTTQNGFYGSADRVINIPLSLITALGIVSLPKITEMITKREEDKAIELIYVSMRFGLWLSCGMVFGLIAISPHFVPVFFGPGYEECEQLIVAISVTLLFLTWSDIIRSHYLIPKKRDRIYIISVAVGVLVNLAIDILLIPKYQAMGAVIGTIITEMIVAITHTFFAKELPIVKMISRSLLYILPGAVMCFIVRWIEGMTNLSIMGLVLEVLCGVVIYLAISVIFLYVTKDVLLDYIFKKVLIFWKKKR